MELIRDNILQLFSNLPVCRIESSAHDYSEDKKESEELYAEIIKKLFTRVVAKEEKNDKCETLIKKTGDLNTYSDYFITTDCSFLLVVGIGLKIKAKKLITSFLQQVLKEDIRARPKIGFIFWVQDMVSVYEIPESTINMITRDRNLTIEDYKRLKNAMISAGSSISTEKILYWCKNLNVPVQIFLGPHIGSERVDLKTRRSRVALVERMCKEYNTIFYVHAPYDYNLCTPKLRLDGIYNDLKDSNSLGVRGVVVHVGKNTSKLPIEVATKRMLENVRKLLQYATVKTPLLIETPASQGSEILTTLEEMCDFYASLESEEREICGICVDTCHVFASGFNPLEYIISLYERWPSALKLIHYNDSEDMCGSCKDRHFPVGGGFKILNKIIKTCELPRIDYVGELGHIGIKDMTAIAEWCNEKNIHMVRE